jgi:hypothetical protein
MATCYFAWDVHGMIAYAYKESLALPVLDLAILGLALRIRFQPQPPSKWIYIGLAGCFRTLLTITVLLMELFQRLKGFYPKTIMELSGSPPYAIGKRGHYGQRNCFFAS